MTLLERKLCLRKIKLLIQICVPCNHFSSDMGIKNLPSCQEKSDFKMNLLFPLLRIILYLPSNILRFYAKVISISDKPFKRRTHLEDYHSLPHFYCSVCCGDVEVEIRKRKGGDVSIYSAEVGFSLSSLNL